MAASGPPARSRATLSGISSRAWEHPADRGALVALRKLKGFDALLKTMSGFLNERRVRLLFLGSGVRVDERQFTELHRLLLDVAHVLDVDEIPEMYVVADPYLNAVTIGLDKPIIVLNSALVDLLDAEELRFVIGHELGHAVSGHAIYRTMLLWLLQFSTVLASIPAGGLAARGIIAALQEWARKSELSADRAGLLATQDPATAYRVHMQLASGGHLEDLDPTAFFAQGQEYENTENIRDSVLKLLITEQRSHPFAVVRASELRRWVDSGEYAASVGGAYPRRSDDADAKLSDAAKEAAKSYTEAFSQTGDMLGKLVHDAAGWLGSAKLWIDEQLRRRGDADA
ncbi:M48 family metallopeptidase [Nocardioides daejeonensis]|uniref:M48 family metallopeptidase n=1 Tax=Nocardioides daejeonensis TaxID=1046556 RepID=UPI000D74189B|nr:M48 family metallopeptidase [Nocardioides daejeonensis]